MAKNYTFAEAVKIINAGTDMESITDIGRRYPILLHKVTKVATQAGEDFVDLMNFMPDYLTANKVNSALKSGVNETSADDADADASNADATETKASETADTNVQDYESMSGKQLWDLLGKAGKRKLAKSTKKSDLVEACKQAFGADANSNNEADSAEAEEVESDATPYSGKSAMELFKECKKRGIKAEAKKPAKFYADLLVKDDAKASEAVEADSESDDWDEDEKPAKKTEKKETKKAAKKEETEDDDWDI